MILSSPPPDSDLISMMGGREAILRFHDMMMRERALKKP
jgi:hypothetical protein